MGFREQEIIAAIAWNPLNNRPEVTFKDFLFFLLLLCVCLFVSLRGRFICLIGYFCFIFYGGCWCLVCRFICLFFLRRTTLTYSTLLCISIRGNENYKKKRLIKRSSNTSFTRSPRYRSISTIVSAFNTFNTNLPK